MVVKWSNSKFVIFFMGQSLIRWMRWCRDQNFARLCWAEVPNFQISLSALSKSWFQIELGATAETLSCSFIAWHVSSSYKKDWNFHSLQDCAILTTETGDWLPGCGLTIKLYCQALSKPGPQILTDQLTLSQSVHWGRANYYLPPRFSDFLTTLLSDYFK